VPAKVVSERLDHASVGVTWDTSPRVTPGMICARGMPATTTARMSSGSSVIHERSWVAKRRPICTTAASLWLAARRSRRMFHADSPLNRDT